MIQYETAGIKLIDADFTIGHRDRGLSISIAGFFNSVFPKKPCAVFKEPG
jgi:hypothetical protein